MENSALLDLIRSGPDSWNEWRSKSQEIIDLSGVDLRHEQLNEIDFSDARLQRAIFAGAKLSKANLFGAQLDYAVFDSADLSGANLQRAHLVAADFFGANLSGASLVDAMLDFATFHFAKLDGADLTRAQLAHTVFARSNLKDAIGLASCWHVAPSSVDLWTLERAGHLHEAFVRGCGLSDDLITWLSSRHSTPPPSCFISYSSEDVQFVSRLHNDLQLNGIRCWKWDTDARTGRSLWGEIDKAIRVYDKLILIASESSLKSPAVNREIERALCQEDQRMKRKLLGEMKTDCDVLFPVRLDDFIFKGWDHERKVDVTKKVIADASRWNIDSAVYQRVLERLLRDLKSPMP